jgi:hypothetical protein
VSVYDAGPSAVIKLLVEGADSLAFAAFYDRHADAERVSSALLRIFPEPAMPRAAGNAIAGPRGWS